MWQYRPDEVGIYAGNGAPTLVARVGALYYDSTNNILYKCSSSTNSVGTWAALAAPATGTLGAQMVNTGNFRPVSSTPGTSQTPSTTETYFAEAYVPTALTVTGISVFNGSDVTGNIKLGIYSAAGVILGQTASTAGSGTAAYQRIALTTPLALAGPQTILIARQASSATARPCALAAPCNMAAFKTTGDTYGTLPTSPTTATTFTADLGPIASLY